MTYVALIEAVALLALVVGLTSILRSQQHAHAREREKLIDKVCHLAGNPWTPAPAVADNHEPEAEQSWEYAPDSPLPGV